MRPFAPPLKRYPGRRPTATSWGLPSGHAQGVAFSLTLIALVICADDTRSKEHKVLIALGMSVVLLAVMIERVVVRCHTIAQVGTGALVGVAFAVPAWKALALTGLVR